MKRCSKCGEEQPLEDFPIARANKDGRYAWCKTCSRAKAKAWYHANTERSRASAKAWKEEHPERVRQYLRDMYERDPSRFTEYNRRYREKHPDRYKALQREGHFRRTYGITPDEYEAMAKKHRGVCAICKQPPPDGKLLCVDHCHASGAIRGLLCQRCNRTLGLFNDDPEWFASAARYLRRK